MKQLLILLFSLLISFNSYGEWKYIQESTSGTLFYVNKDNFREHNGFVYWWILADYLVPLENTGGVMSTKGYHQGDCGVMRYKTLSRIHYFQPMGNGENMTSTASNPKWEYANPDGIDYHILDYVCDYVK